MKRTTFIALIAFVCSSLSLSLAVRGQDKLKIRELPSVSLPASGDYFILATASPVMTSKMSVSQFVTYLSSALALGEVNTASNVGAAGVGVYDSKSGVDLRFRKISAASSKVSVTLNSQQVDIDLGVHDSAAHTGNILPSGAGQVAGGGYVDFSSAASVGNPTTGIRRLEVDPGTGELSIKNSIGNFISLENHVPLLVAEGGLNLTSATDDTVPVGNGTTWQGKTLPNCTDTGGQHINYTQSSNAFSCGTSGAASLSATNDVAHGGTAVTTLAAHGVLLGNGTSPVIVTSTGTAGQVLTSNGPSADPTYQASASSLERPLVKPIDQNVNSSTLVADGYLAKTFNSGNVYTFVFRVHLNDLSTGATGGFKATLGGTVGFSYLIAQATLTTNANIAPSDIERFTAFGQTVSTMATDVQMYLEIGGTIEVTSTGTFRLEWAQASATILGGGVTVLAGSSFEYHVAQ